MEQLKRVRCLNAKEGPEIDHEHNRDNPISKKHEWSLDVSRVATLYEDE